MKSPLWSNTQSATGLVFHNASVTFIAFAEPLFSALALSNIHACHGNADYFPGLVEAG